MEEQTKVEDYESTYERDTKNKNTYERDTNNETAYQKDTKNGSYRESRSYDKKIKRIAFAMEGRRA